MGTMIFLILILNLALAKTPLSAVRSADQDYKSILRGAAEPGDPQSDSALSSTEDVFNQPWLKLTESEMDPVTLQSLFEEVRDLQPLKDENKNPRRLTWLYPDDGCYARSAMAQQQLKTRGQGQFQQIFVFGNLVAETNNHPSGQVNWWYHVVPIIKTSFGTFVFDPALEPNHPLLIDQWIDTIMPHRFDAKASLCAPATYSPEDICKTKGAIKEEAAIHDETEVYLDLEWSRLSNLGRDPKKELGDEPPWSTFPFHLINH